ncbi:MAG: hypothetical protein BWY92_01278 [Firmicutes bacterium ADurb.BinA052]|nr:MAG: hypothetical protein BWY92_01278 [Firmicutes bacterium ADurb.BinA052]
MFNLYKGLPIGAVTWGAGNIGAHAISTLAKDFRSVITAGDADQRVDPANYTIEEVARRFAEFIHNEHYQPEFRDLPSKPPLGLAVSGYSSGSDFPEEWQIDLGNGGCHGPRCIVPSGECSMNWSGQPEVIARICWGYSPRLLGVLQNLGLEPQQAKEFEEVCRNYLQAPLVHPSMPIKDAIDLAEYLVDCTIGFQRFMPGPDTVGGPVEVAAITKHEGFKWIARKHYFSIDLNSGKEEWLCNAVSPRAEIQDRCV